MKRNMSRLLILVHYSTPPYPQLFKKGPKVLDTKVLATEAKVLRKGGEAGQKSVGGPCHPALFRQLEGFLVEVTVSCHDYHHYGHHRDKCRYSECARQCTEQVRNTSP